MSSHSQSLSRDQIQKQFDRAADTYDSVASIQRRMGEALLPSLWECLSNDRDSPILDLGCGTGELLLQLHQSGCRELTGLDLSSQMIRVSQAKVPEARFLHADIESIPVRDAAFPLIVSNAALQWCDLEVAAREIHRVLHPDGRLVCTCFAEGTLRQWHQAFVSHGFQSRVHLLRSPREIGDHLRAAGFRLLQSKTLTESASFDSIESMFQSIRRLGAGNAMASRMQPIKRSEYRKVRDHFQRMLDADGKLELDFVWAELLAEPVAIGA